MKSWLLVVMSVICVLLSDRAAGATKPKMDQHRVVFEVVSDIPAHHEALLNNLENILKALGPGTEVVVVAHGGGLSLLQKPQPALAKRMEELSRQRVTFAACENTMRKKGVRQQDLLSFTTTVDSGIAEVVRRQEAGWSYIKSGT